MSYELFFQDPYILGLIASNFGINTDALSDPNAVYTLLSVDCQATEGQPGCAGIPITPEPVPVPPPAPVPPEASSAVPVCAPGTTDVTGEELKGNKNHPEPISVAIVNTKVEDLETVWKDNDGDGNAWESKNTKDGVEYSIDKDEVNMEALPSEDKIQKDIVAYQAQNDGKMPEHLWYTFTDCNGKSLVLCYDVEHKCWGVLKDLTWEPPGQEVIARPVIDTKEELDAYLLKERVHPRV